MKTNYKSSCLPCHGRQALVKGELWSGLPRTLRALVCLTGRQAMTLCVVFTFLVLLEVEAKDYLSLIERTFIENRWEEVIETGNEWKDAESYNPAPYYFMSYAYFASYHPDEGYEYNSKSEREDPGAEKFLPVAEEMTSRHPDNSHLYILLGNTYLQAEELARAIKTLKKAIKLNSGYGGAYFALGNTYELSGRARKAASIYKKGIRSDPAFLPNYEELGFYYYLQGREAKTEEILRKGIEKSTKYRHFVRLNSKLGKIYLRNKEYDKAINILRVGLELKPKDRMLNWTLGDVYKESGRLDKAEKFYRELLETEGICCKSVIRGRLSDIIIMQREERAAK